ncbi:hypothetical protein [Nonomuraea candida]|uniref:hypothetical protein n=1 Tax=Nonomuraea candida TaxID=359159 RepID=UPI0012F9E7D9|nr:hypothetical protein [Nonomuraea candida]
MRVRAALHAPLLLLLAACAPAPPPAPPATPPAPSTTPPAPSATSATPRETPASTSDATPGTSGSSPSGATRPSAADGPGTVCGQVKAANGEIAAVAVDRGRADCAQAVRVLRAYYRPQTPKQGTAGIATVAGWECVSNTAARSMETGRLTSCRKGSATIVADVIP